MARVFDRKKVRYRGGGVDEATLFQSEVGVLVGDKTSFVRKNCVTLGELEQLKGYAAETYLPSLLPRYEKKLKHIKEKMEVVNNAATMTMKVEMNKGFAFVDKQLFFRETGVVLELEDFPLRCYLKMYYKNDKSAISKRLKIIADGITERWMTLNL